MSFPRGRFFQFIAEVFRQNPCKNSSHSCYYIKVQGCLLVLSRVFILLLLPLLVSLDQTQVTTLVQGTSGYLDPEYFHTSQLTEKSDVYSFGVVLAELLTGRLPLDTAASEHERSLAAFFMRSIKENRLFQVLETQLVREGSFEQCQGVAELVKRCLRLTSEERPTMKEVAMELEELSKYTKHPWSQTQQCQDEETLGLIQNKHRTFTRSI
ncbi:hypothetical protein K7X08_028537 [Anisodus acutangulus]|uniref:Protein kinase domain-containing protein n=1 Tax=Anisodus acutangulus TaxID=402998 RepID=A0A9Q1M998_9SOLA|nr:hypothetical protein K7X08_028537 [Anisodus acutangulus]